MNMNWKLGLQEWTGEAGYAHVLSAQILKYLTHLALSGKHAHAHEHKGAKPQLIK